MKETAITCVALHDSIEGLAVAVLLEVFVHECQNSDLALAAVRLLLDSVNVEGVEVGLQEESSHFRALGQVDGPLAVHVAYLGEVVSAPVDDELGRVHVVHGRSYVERRPALAVLGSQVGPSLDQKTERSQLALEHAAHDRGQPAGLALADHAAAEVSDQLFHLLHVSVHDGLLHEHG